MKSFFLFALACCCLTGTVYAQTNLQLPTSSFRLPSDALGGFDRYELVELDFSALNSMKADQLNFSLTTAQETITFTLGRWDMRKYSHQLHTSGRKGQGKILPREASGQFRGTTNDGSVATFTVDPLFTKGRWARNGEKYNLEPLWRLHEGAPRNLYLLYVDTDVKDIPGGCGTPAVFHPHDQPIPETNKAAGECFEVEIAIAADFEMFQDFGNAASVENFMLGVLMDVQTNYDDEFEDALEYVVVATEIATSEGTDPWTNSTDPFDLLPNFRNWANAGGFGAGVAFDVASLWSDRDFDGTTVGLASVGAVCTNSRYNVLQQFNSSATSMRVMWTHELGHNFGSFHDPNEAGDPVWIMSPFVSSSTEWSPQSINAIVNYYSGVNCLENCPVPDPPIAQSSVFLDDVCVGSLVSFFDDTEGRVDSRLWSFPGGTPSTSTDIAPIVTYSAPGNYQAVLTVTNQFGQDQTQISVLVSEAAVGASTVLFYENFEDTDLDVNIINADGLNTWFLSEADGNQGNIGIRVNNYDNDLRGTSDVMELPAMDLTGVSNPLLEFEYAYHRYSATLSDRLRVFANTGNGDVLLFEGQENGSQNFATGPDNEDRFIPGSDEDWCYAGPGCISLDLSALGDLSNVTLKIENINGFGNLMWVDNIAVTGNCTGSLPVEWLSFTAEPRNKVADLNWLVNQQEGHLGFEVERRTNSTDWSSLAWVPATTARSEGVNYQFTDATITAGTTYFYRLRQQDQDGSEAFSEIRKVTFGAISELAVWPNPTTNKLNIQSPNGAELFALHNTLGQVMLRGKLTDGRGEVSLQDAPAGVYFLRVGEDKVVRVVKR